MKYTAVKWFSNQSYELFEQYSEGKFDRQTLNKLMHDAEIKASEMQKNQTIDLLDETIKTAFFDAGYRKKWIDSYSYVFKIAVEKLYNKTFSK
jgi:hypothetical protein